MYAIIRSGNRQYRVQQGDRIAVARLPASAGEQVTFDDVLLVEEDGAVTVGAPTVPGASVSARVEAQLRAPAVLSLRYKNKTRHRRLRGNRQHLTRVEITSITTGG